MASGFINWGSIVTALIVALVVSIPAQILAAIFIQPWALRRQRLADKRETPTACSRCKTEVPAWFIQRPGTQCRMCRGTFWRYPTDGDTAKSVAREHRALNARNKRHWRRTLAYAKKRARLPPPPPEE